MTHFDTKLSLLDIKQLWKVTANGHVCQQSLLVEYTEKDVYICHTRQLGLDSGLLCVWQHLQIQRNCTASNSL